MNTTPFATKSAFPSIHPPATAGRRQGYLSARQLLDVELGLFLLSQLLPSAPPDALPGLLCIDQTRPAGQTGWTPRQRKYLTRARILLRQFQQGTTWQETLDRYVASPNLFRPAFDISADRSSFAGKNVGFFRNRFTTFRQVLS